jgi:hypothetical protein
MHMKRANCFTTLGLLLAIAAPAVQAQTPPTLSADAQAALALAEEIYPQLFSGGTALRFDAGLGYTYRYYAGTGTYVGFKDGHIYVKGPQFGSDIYDKGAEAAVLAQLEAVQAQLTLSADAEAALALAEEIYPELFSGGAGLSYDASLGTYRFYADTGAYIAFKDGHVYVQGPQFGAGLFDKGAEAAVVAKLEDVKASISAPGGCNEEVTGQLGCGDWDITISGTVSSTIFGMTTVIDLDELVVEDVPMENPTSEDEIEDILNSYYEDIGTITNLEVVIVSQSDDHIILDLAFDSAITQQGITVTQSYDLRYDMNKN